MIQHRASKSLFSLFCTYTCHFECVTMTSMATCRTPRRTHGGKKVEWETLDTSQPQWLPSWLHSGRGGTIKQFSVLDLRQLEKKKTFLHKFLFITMCYIGVSALLLAMHCTAHWHSVNLYNIRFIIPGVI